jgi:drug/metabolite transporter (DMT)-like permease
LNLLRWAAQRLQDIDDLPYTSRRGPTADEGSLADEEQAPAAEGMMRVRTRELVATAAIAAYLLFAAALMLAVIAAGSAVPGAAAIVGLLAVSLPALGAWLYIDFTGWTGPELASRVVRWSAMGVGILTSALGFLLAIWSFSRVAAFVAVVEICVLYVAISGLSLLREEPDWRR